MANTILNFHFDYLHTSLKVRLKKRDRKEDSSSVQCRHHLFGRWHGNTQEVLLGGTSWVNLSFGSPTFVIVFCLLWFDFQLRSSWCSLILLINLLTSHGSHVANMSAGDTYQLWWQGTESLSLCGIPVTDHTTLIEGGRKMAGMDLTLWSVKILN